MKSLKQLLSEVEAEPKSEEEKRFVDLHKNMEVIDYVIPQDHVFSGVVERQPRLADTKDDEAKYDTSYVSKEPTKPIPVEESSDKKLDGRRKHFKEKLKALLYAKTHQEKVSDALADQLLGLEETAAEEIPMMEKQLAFISYAADEISEYVRKSGDPEEWYQNKLAEAHGSIKSLYAYAQGEMNMMSTPAMAEETEVEEGCGDGHDKKKMKKEAEVEEDAAAFIFAAAAAKRDGKKKFKFGGKEFPVTIKGDVAKPKSK